MVKVTKAKVLSVEGTSQHKKYCPDFFMCHKSLTFWVKFKEDHSPFNPLCYTEFITKQILHLIHHLGLYINV